MRQPDRPPSQRDPPVRPVGRFRRERRRRPSLYDAQQPTARASGPTSPRTALAHPLHPGAGLVQPPVRGVVRRRRAERGLQLPRPSRRSRQRRSHRAAGGRRARRPAQRHLRGADRRGQASLQRPPRPRRRTRRPCRAVPADDPRGHRLDARRRPHRRRALRRLRGVLGRQPSARASTTPERRSSSPQTAAGAKGKVSPLKPAVDQPSPTATVRHPETVEHVLVVKRGENEVEMDRRPRHLVARGRAAGLERARGRAFPAENPLFILYTSGPPEAEGILHTSGATSRKRRSRTASCTTCTPRRRLLVHGRHRLDHRPHLRRLRPARQRRDAAALRGHPGHPAPGRWWELIQNHGVTVFYNRTHGDPLVHEDRARRAAEVRPVVAAPARLRREPINPEAWVWYREIIGADETPIVDTGGRPRRAAIMISALPGVTETKPARRRCPCPDLDRGGRRRRRTGRTAAAVCSW